MRVLKTILLTGCAIIAALAARGGSPFWLGWEPTVVVIGNDHDGFADSVPARRMLSDTNTVAVAALPYLGRTPEQPDRIVLACSDLSVRSAYAGILQTSEDGGETWSPLQTSGAHLGFIYGLQCCGNGVMVMNDGCLRSTDDGRSWCDLPRPADPRFPRTVVGWDPPLVVKGSDGKHLIGTGYYCADHNSMNPKVCALMRESMDAGATWQPWRGIPEFPQSCETALAYNAKGEIVAAIRQMVCAGCPDDQYAQLCTSVSTDGAKTWAYPKVVAGSGRHHPCFALLPDGRLVLSYVVRMGYPNEDGKFAYGVEAVISYDDGRTWDTDHRYILAKWTNDCVFTDAAGNRVSMPHYMAAPQNTSTIYLPKEDCLLTAYGTAQNRCRITAEGQHVYHQVALVKWRPLDRAKYAKEKMSAPAPVSADAALADLRRKDRHWAVCYSARIGLPDAGWTCYYPEDRLSTTNGFLRLDHTNKNWGFLLFRGTDQLERMNCIYGLRMKLRLPTFADTGLAYRFAVNPVVDTGPERNSLYFAIDKGLVLHGTFGDLQLPVKPDEAFLLEIWADKRSRTVRIWVDGKLICEKPFAPKYVKPETPASLYFGAGQRNIDGFAELGFLQFGAIE